MSFWNVISQANLIAGITSAQMSLWRLMHQHCTEAVQELQKNRLARLTTQWKCKVIKFKNAPVQDIRGSISSSLCPKAESSFKDKEVSKFPATSFQWFVIFIIRRLCGALESVISAWIGTVATSLLQDQALRAVKPSWHRLHLLSLDWMSINNNRSPLQFCSYWSKQADLLYFSPIASLTVWV